ncbi:MAG: UbiA family prenyltransferase [Chloroflexi bacterium]|nr:UbiA family prenyltransferase [Chloroflexota bacterium]
MGLAALSRAGQTSLAAYLEVLKPRETAMLTFIGMASALAAGGGTLRADHALAGTAILLGSAGCNGLTNYLDREVDALMERTRHRSLPSGRISPAERVLPLVLGLIAAGLGLAWLLSPWAFAFGSLGTLAAVLWRKTGLTHWLGAISGASPVLVGWFAIYPRATPTIGLLSLLVLLWVPLHVWSLMSAWREDYWQAGVRVSPLGWPASWLDRALAALSLMVAATGLALYPVADLGKPYLAAAAVMGLMLVAVGGRLALAPGKATALRLFRLATYPYLGLIFLALALDPWL